MFRSKKKPIEINKHSANLFFCTMCVYYEGLWNTFVKLYTGYNKRTHTFNVYNRIVTAWTGLC